MTTARRSRRRADGRAGRTGEVPPRRAVPAVRQVRPAMHTVRDLLRYALSRFEAAGLAYGHGTDNGYDEAAWLVLWALHLPLERLEPFLDARLTPPERDTVLQLIDRRCKQRVPAAYLTGEAWLRGHRFLADRRALIPRSLIAEALDDSAGTELPQAPATVLDLCTGGGSLAILTALRWPRAQVTGTDLSPDALALAAENVALYGLADRISLLQGNLFEPVHDRSFDLILCNPPYVNQASIDALPAEYRAEPAGALAGGGDGMTLVAPIIAQAAVHLNRGAGMLIEIGHERAAFEAVCHRLEFSYLPVTAGEDQLVWVTRTQLAARR